MSASTEVPSAHITPPAVKRSGSGWRCSTPAAIPACTSGVRISPVTLTTLRGARPARTRSSTSATAARPASASNGPSCHTGGRRVTQVVAAATGAISSRSCTADVPPPTTTTRFPANSAGPR